MRVAYLWTGNERAEAHMAEPLPGRMHMNLLPAVLDECDALHWDERATWGGEYDLIVVQHFTRNYSVIKPVREKFPMARIAIRPDRPPEWEVRNRSEDFHWLLTDLAQADVILDAMPDGRRAAFWAQMVSKPWDVLPSPIVPHPDVAALRTQKREDFVLGWLHPSDHQHHLPTLAALAAVQRATGIAVQIITAEDESRHVGVDLGMNAKYLPMPTHEGFIDLLSSARMVVDLFPMHTPGRVVSVAAYLGTPTVSAFETPNVGHERVDAWSGNGVGAALTLLNNTNKRRAAIKAGIALMDERHSPAAIRAAVERLAGVSYETPETIHA